MTAPQVTGPAGSSPEANSAPPPPDSWQTHTARSVTRWARCGAVITVVGEVDAANAAQLADYVQRCAVHCEWLVLDLHDLEFIGTAGFSALQSINTRCAQIEVYWTMVPGVAVSRLLRLYDPHSALPTAESVPAILATAQDDR